MKERSNPFQNSDEERAAIWDMLVTRDIAAYVRQDWAPIENDFDDESFEGIDARLSFDPDDWVLAFPDVESYREQWLANARDTASKRHLVAIEDALYDATELDRIEVAGDRATAYKKFNGWFRPAGEPHVRLEWQTVYRMRRVAGSWKIAGFVGFLPLRAAGTRGLQSAKGRPAGAVQHTTAGPYSPVLHVRPDELVVISGQAAIGPTGELLGESVEDQTHATLANCIQQLGTAGCTLAEVFKVNVYMSDLGEWQRFNAVYESYMPDPAPVRTAVQAVLLPGLRVEVEMWAAPGR